MHDSTPLLTRRRLPPLLVALTACFAHSACTDPQAPSIEELASFAITLPDSAVAGEPIQLSIAAVGTDGTRPLLDFEGTVSLSVSSGAVTPDQLTLLNGVGTAEVVVGPAAGEVVLEVAAGGRSSTMTLHLTAPRRLAGTPSDPAVQAIPDLAFRPFADSYADGHPDFVGVALSVSTALVTLEPSASIGDVNGLLTSLGAEIVGGIPGEGGTTSGLLYLRFPSTSHAEMDAILEALEADSAVLAATADEIVPGESLPITDTPAAGWIWDGVLLADGNWGLELSRVPQMWNLNRALEALGPRQVRVGVVDRGFDVHPDLSPIARFGPAISAGHGTHVAGTIGATFGNGDGIDGVTPYADLYLAADSTITFGSIFDGIAVLAEAGVRVINISLGKNWKSRHPDDSPRNVAQVRRLAIQFERLHETVSPEGRPVLIVASAGNDSQARTVDARFNGPWTYAALERGFEHVIVVEATELDTAGEPVARRADFSNVGGHVSAPGTQILSTDQGNGYELRDGTSMAAPFVTGLVGYLLSVAPDLTNTEIRDILQTTAVPVETSGDGTAARPRVDAFAAVVDIDRIRGDGRVLRMLLDIDDGTPDGNLRVEPGDPGVPFYEGDADLNGRPGDGDIDMSDFRRWRDLYLEYEGIDGTVIDGPEDHPKRDLNDNGLVVDDPDDPLYPLADFNGDGKLSPFDTAAMAGALTGFGGMSDLEVLQALFDDPDYDADELPELLESGDVLVQLSSWVLDWDGRGEVGSTIETVFEDGSTQERASRIHSVEEPLTVYTLPASELPWQASAWVVAPEGDTICIVHHDVTVAPGSDEYWTPSCGRTLEVEVGLDDRIEPGVSSQVVVRAGIAHEGGPLRYEAGLDVALRVSGGSAAALTGTTNEDGLFVTTVTMDAGVTVLTVTADVSEPRSGLTGSGQATATPPVAGGRVIVRDLRVGVSIGAYAGVDPGTRCSDSTDATFTEVRAETWSASHSCSAFEQETGHSANVSSFGSVGFDFAEDSTSVTGLTLAMEHDASDSMTGLANGAANLNYRVEFSVTDSVPYQVDATGAVEEGRVFFALWRLGDFSEPVWDPRRANGGREAEIIESGVLPPGSYEFVLTYMGDRGHGELSVNIDWR